MLIGFNCSLGPQEILPLAKELRQYTSLPDLYKTQRRPTRPADRGTTRSRRNNLPRRWPTICRWASGSLAAAAAPTREFIAAMIGDAAEPLPGEYPAGHPSSASPRCCTPTAALCAIDRVRVIGERINPTGKKRLKQAILERDFDYILSQGLSQVEAGADILDVNVGMPDIDEARSAARGGTAAAEPCWTPRCRSTPPTRKRWRTPCGSTTARRLSTRSTARRGRCRPSCRWSKSTARRWSP